MSDLTDALFTETNVCTTENGAVTYKSTGSVMIDQFAKAGSYIGRPVDDVFADQKALWEEDPLSALRFPFYLRMITRKTRLDAKSETEKVQRGQGNRDEAFKRLLWIAREHSEDFYRNIWMLPIVGSWKDLWSLMVLDMDITTRAIDRRIIYYMIAHGLTGKSTGDLCRKYMPRIKSLRKCVTQRAKYLNLCAVEFARMYAMTAREYNKVKTEGKAHDFQKLMCARQYDKIDWGKIPGKALMLITSGKFIESHNLFDSYKEWVLRQPVVKFNGYPFELAAVVRKARMKNKGHVPFVVSHTVDAQFNQLLETAEKDGKITENVLCALDTSGSMNTEIKGLNGITCSDVANSLAVFFAKLNKGEFHDKVMMFDDTSYPYTIVGDGYSEIVERFPRVPCGGTNFQSIVDELVKIRVANPSIPLDEYPTTILVVSDMQFNAYGEKTNLEASIEKLSEVFPSEYVDRVKWVWWDCTGRHTDVQDDKPDDGRSFFFSGFDGAAISLLLNEDEKKKGERPTAADVINSALNQEALQLVDLAENGMCNVAEKW